ncbi:MAG TPA: hypothetical protein VKU60_13665, partial [Chloroflexota bacterium]|nr:hypothetical protein [Chloroflexota bacterium]
AGSRASRSLIWLARYGLMSLVLLLKLVWRLTRAAVRLAVLASVWLWRTCRRRLALERQRAIQGRLAADEARLAAAAEAVLASVPAQPVLVQASIPVTARPVQATAAAAPEPTVEPVIPPSLAQLEELLADGLATLDRGEEGLAYHIFAKATEQRAPKDGGEAYLDAIKRAWFWRAKTAETVEEVVRSLESALRLDPGNLQMQAHLAWTKQRLEREQKLLPFDQPTVPPGTPSPYPLHPTPYTLFSRLGIAVRLLGGLMALALAALWMTTGVLPALGRYLSQLPAGDELVLRRLVLTLNATALPGQGHLPLPMVNYDLGLSLPFVLAFLFVFTARGLLDGEPWARTGGVLLAAVGGWLCLAVVSNPEAARLGLALCLGIVVAALAGRFESPKVLPRVSSGY